MTVHLLFHVEVNQIMWKLTQSKDTEKKAFDTNRRVEGEEQEEETEPAGDENGGRRGEEGEEQEHPCHGPSARSSAVGSGLVRVWDRQPKLDYLFRVLGCDLSSAEKILCVFVCVCVSIGLFSARLISLNWFDNYSGTFVLSFVRCIRSLCFQSSHRYA